MSRTATAARLIEHGKPIEVQPLELPEPSDDEAVVVLRFAGLNPVDRYAIEGKVAAEGPLPRTIGGEASGLVDGRPVVVAGAGLGATPDGVFATAAVVPKSTIFELPDGVAHDEAAALGVVGLTAWRVVELAEVGASDRVLVLGGAGGVGQSLISYAASKGATVWGQTGSESKAAAITEFGAERAVIAGADELYEAVREFAPTVVFDPLGGSFTSSALLAIAPRGQLVLFGTSSADEAKIQLKPLYRGQIQLRTYAGIIATPEERAEGLRHSIGEFAAGRLRIRVGRRVALDSVNEAFEAMADRSVVGKVVLDLR
ncbi:MAG: quinone oxidoreductase family protein [Gaiellaceae bacterium]